MTEITIKIGTPERYVIGTTLNFTSFEFHLFDKEKGKYSLIRHIVDVDHTYCSDLMAETTEVFDTLDNIFAERISDEKE